MASKTACQSRSAKVGVLGALGVADRNLELVASEVAELQSAPRPTQHFDVGVVDGHAFEVRLVYLPEGEQLGRDGVLVLGSGPRDALAADSQRVGETLGEVVGIPLPEGRPDDEVGVGPRIGVGWFGVEPLDFADAKVLGRRSESPAHAVAVADEVLDTDRLLDWVRLAHSSVFGGRTACI